jgi:hypothetical protein
VTAPSNVWVRASKLAEVAGSISPGYGYLSLVSVVFCSAEIFAMGRSLVQGSPTECVFAIYKPPI